MRKLLAATYIVLGLSATAQNETDALRYSMLDYQGTSRFNSMAGAFTALGADLSMVSLNPAGMGVYKKSEFSFTPAMLYANTTGTYNGSTLYDEKFDFIFSNAGFVWNFDPKSTEWRGLSIGLGYNRLASFNNRFHYKGEANTSFLDPYVNMLNVASGTDAGIISSVYPYNVNLGYQTYLINPTPLDSFQYNHVLSGIDGLLQEKTVVTRGGIGETFFAIAANYESKLYIGGSFGFPSVRYVEESSYTESPPTDDTLSGLKEYQFNYYQRTNGNGFNAKLGVIYRPADWLRLALAYHSPTFYGLTDRWETSINAIYTDGSDFTENSPNGAFDFALTTPGRALGGLAIVLAKRGLISVDYELTDYRNARLRTPRAYISSAYDFESENNAINDNYIQGHNVRIGTEWRLSTLRIRGGYGIVTSPYNPAVSDAGARKIMSAGLGYKNDDYYVDLGYRYVTIANEHYPYATSSVATIDEDHHLLSLTLGFRY